MKMVTSVLVLSHQGLGDIISSIPIYNALRTEYPDATITSTVKGYSEKRLLESQGLSDLFIMSDIYSMTFVKRFFFLLGFLFKNYSIVIAPVGINIKYAVIIKCVSFSKKMIAKIKNKLEIIGIKEFVIFHPSAQYKYKVYSQKLRDDLLKLLSQLNITVVVTGGSNEIDLLIKKSLPKLDNVLNWIGQTSIEEYIALSEISKGYIGMDTLNMHIAAAQNKRVFAIFGPTRLSMWSPWSNELQVSATKDMPIQHYGNITIFQADMPCVACGKAGCKDKKGISECLDNIRPQVIANEVEKWFKYARF